MEKENFFEKAAESVRSRLGEEYQVSLKKITKNNQVVLNGLVIAKESINISPTIYLDVFWQSYRWGMSLDAIADKILEVYERESPKESISMEYFKDFEKVKDRICYKLVNFEENRELLKDVPHIRFLDLAICFYYSYFEERIGKGSILIYNSHMELWKTNAEELHEIASTNSQRLFPADFCTMEEILSKLYSEAEEDEEDEMSGERGNDEIPMYVLTNSARIFGASVILYDHVLRNLSERFQCDLLIIPSSVHEVILLKEDGTNDGSNIKRMIHEVNETQVEPEDRLSDSVYKYERSKDKLSVLC